MGKSIKVLSKISRNLNKIKILYTLLFLFFLGCEGKIKPEDISSKSGTTWYYQHRLLKRIHADDQNRNFNEFNGVILYSSGLALNIRYDRSTGIEEIRRLCFDCGNFKSLKDEYCEWSLKNNILKIFKEDMKIYEDVLIVLHKDTILLIKSHDSSPKDTFYMIRVIE